MIKAGFLTNGFLSSKVLIVLMLSVLLVGCQAPADDSEPVAVAETTTTTKIDETTTAPIETQSESEMALLIEGRVVALQSWDEDKAIVDLIGTPQSENLEVLGSEADTFSGSFVKTMNYDGLEILFFSPKDDGKRFWVKEMRTTSSAYETVSGIKVGSSVTDLLAAYEAAEIWPDGRTDPMNCSYVKRETDSYGHMLIEVADGLIKEIRLYVEMP